MIFACLDQLLDFRVFWLFLEVKGFDVEGQLSKVLQHGDLSFLHLPILTTTLQVHNLLYRQVVTFLKTFVLQELLLDGGIFVRLYGYKIVVFDDGDHHIEKRYEVILTAGFQEVHLS